MGQLGAGIAATTTCAAWVGSTNDSVTPTAASTTMSVETLNPSAARGEPGLAARPQRRRPWVMVVARYKT
jgi:hypothetical protein